MIRVKNTSERSSRSMGTVTEDAPLATSFCDGLCPNGGLVRLRAGPTPEFVGETKTTRRVGAMHAPSAAAWRAPRRRWPSLHLSAPSPAETRTRTCPRCGARSRGSQPRRAGDRSAPWRTARNRRGPPWDRGRRQSTLRRHSRLLAPCRNAPAGHPPDRQDVPCPPPTQRRPRSSEHPVGRGQVRAPIDQWITSSARTSTVCGIVRPSALAVFRLITSSNLFGCSTGRSAGLAPLRILST